MSAKASTATKQTKKAASSAAEFKKRKKGAPLELPSGLIVVARRVELRSYIQRGEVPNALMGVVEEALAKGREADVSKMVGSEDGKVDLDMVNDMYEMVDGVVMESIVDPKVHPLVWTEQDAVDGLIPEDSEVGDEIAEEEKDDSVLYIDEVDDEDKMFIFQWTTGGTADLATFRQEASASLDALAPGQKPGKPSKSAARTRGR